VQRDPLCDGAKVVEEGSIREHVPENVEMPSRDVASDEALARLAQRSDSKAFSRLYERFIDPIYRYVYRKTGNREEAEDLTQETFTKVFQGIDGFRSESSFKTWIYRIATNVVMDHWRRHYKARSVPLEDFLSIDSANPDIEVDKSSGSVERLLSKLPENYRKVLELRFMKGLSIKETSQHLGITEGNTKVLQYRALKRASELGECDDER